MRWVKGVKCLEEYVLELCFDNGERRRVDLRPHLSGEIFEPLKDVQYFRQVVVNTDIDTIVWPNNADFSPDFLYEISESLTEVAKPAKNNN
ncbi:MAG: hypothetical protein A2W80_07190 [Candidatus Riflebacteria bacterium GWC2_50_8]|nr:MAG: hypothetical protein A2W80_07190 [Candidatus Riflebacteria bacterium GWC2_50_8]